MTHRSTWKYLAFVAILGAANLLACAKEEPKKPAAPAAAAPAPKPEPLKVAFVYVGPVGDAGWTYAHDLGRKYAEAKYGDRIKTTFVEKVPEGPDAERVIRDLVAQGNKLIFATSFGFGDAMEKVAKDFPDVYFEHATGYKMAPNLRVYEGRFYEDAYLAGIVAGDMTKTNVIGFVGSFPIPEVLRNINAFTLGAQSVNPKVKTAVLQTAEKNGKFAFGWDSDMSAFAPKAHLGSARLNWGIYYEKAIGDVLNKTWKSEATKWGVKEGLPEFVSIAAFVPDATKKKVEDAKAGMKDGTVAPFKGPLLDNTGKEVLAKGVVSDDKWNGAVNFYVKGVEGKVPSGK
jgi:basic membrane protein A